MRKIEREKERRSRGEGRRKETEWKREGGTGFGLNIQVLKQFVLLYPTCLSGSSMAITNLDKSIVVDLMASVLPYLNIRKEALS